MRPGLRANGKAAATGGFQPARAVLPHRRAIFLARNETEIESQLNRGELYTRPI